MALPENGTIAAIMIGLGNLAGMYWQYLREGRQHQWEIDKEERDHFHRQALATATQQNTAQGVAALTTKIDENTAVNEAALHEGKRAYTEANNLSTKILTVGLQMRAPSRSTDQVLAQDTNATAHRIDDKLDKP
jgi:hypothetical protein